MSEQVVSRDDLVKINDNLYEIPRSFRSDMRVPARVYMNEEMIDDVLQDKSFIFSHSLTGSSKK